MQLEHSFSVPVGIDEAWKILLDIERVGPCMPGALIDSVDGDNFTGTVKLKLGPINLTYKGKASFVEKDEAAHRAVIDARGRDARGNGTAAAKVTATLVAAGSSTTVQVNTDLDITGKPAQFGRGVMVDVGNKLIGQFADALAATLGAGGDAGGAGAPAAPDATAPAAEAPDATAPAAEALATKAGAAKKVARPRPRAAAAAPAEATAAEATADTTPTDTTPTDTTPADTTPAELGATADPETEAALGATAEAALPHEAEGGNAQAVAEPDKAAPAGPISSANGHTTGYGAQPQREVEPINLLESAGPAVAKRLAPVAVALVIVLGAMRRRRGKQA